MTNGLSLEELMKEGTYPEEYAEGENWRILHGDTLKLVKAFQPGIFDAVITDPPYASGGTKQNERNRTTNQKYSSMSAANALPDFDGDNKIRDHGLTGWPSGFTMCGKPARKELRSVCSLTGVSIHRLPMHCSGQDGFGEEQRCGIRETPVHRKAVSASRLNTLCGAVTDRCQSTVRYLVCRASSDMEIRRTGFM